MSAPLVFTVPLPPQRANARGHWAGHHRQKKSYWTLLTVMRQNGLLPRRVEGMNSAEVEAVLYPHRIHDQDGAMSRLKWLLDWLVKSGYLVDDSPTYLRWRGVPTQAKPASPELRGWVTLTLYPPASVVVAA